MNSEGSHRNLIHSEVCFTVRDRLVCAIDKSSVGACCTIGSSRTKVIRHLCVEFIGSLCLRTPSIASTFYTSASTSFTSSRAPGRRLRGRSRFWVTLWVSGYLQQHSPQMASNLRNSFAQAFSRNWRGGSGSIKDDLDLTRLASFLHSRFEVMKTFIGRLSTSRPLSLRRASFAAVGLEKIIVATPRLTPLGPYVMIARLTGPTDLPKYSYIRRISTELVHWHAAWKNILHGIAL